MYNKPQESLFLLIWAAINLSCKYLGVFVVFILPHEFGGTCCWYFSEWEFSLYETLFPLALEISSLRFSTVGRSAASPHTAWWRLPSTASASHQLCSETSCHYFFQPRKKLMSSCLAALKISFLSLIFDGLMDLAMVLFVFFIHIFPSSLNLDIYVFLQTWKILNYHLLKNFFPCSEVHMCVCV